MRERESERKLKAIGGGREAYREGDVVESFVANFAVGNTNKCIAEKSMSTMARNEMI